MTKLVRPSVVLTLFLLVLTSALGAGEPPGGEELKKLLPDLGNACAIVREKPSIWPVRSFPYGPLGLEARKATPVEADRIRNFHLGLVAAACRIPQDRVTAAFFCGPDCPKNRRDHLVKQLSQVRTTVAAFELLTAVRMVSIWAPVGEVRVNDVFVVGEQIREAIPSPKLGLVPSGEWKLWASMDAYLSTIDTKKAAVDELVQGMRGIGLSALIREAFQIRLVGVGVGDNESGLLFLRDGSKPPKVGDDRSDGRSYVMVEDVAPAIMYYETS